MDQRRQMAEKTWLGYFNQTLYERGIITEADRNRLALRIDSRRPIAGARLPAAPEKEQAPHPDWDEP